MCYVEHKRKKREIESPKEIQNMLKQIRKHVDVKRLEEKYNKDENTKTQTYNKIKHVLKSHDDIQNRLYNIRRKTDAKKLENNIVNNRIQRIKHVSR